MDIKVLYNSGRLPGKYYYQLNNESVEHNYQEQRQKLLQRISDKRTADTVKQNIDESIELIIADLLAQIEL